MFLSSRWYDLPPHHRIVTFREDLSQVLVKTVRKRKPMELDQLKRRLRKVILDEEGDYVQPNRPKHVYKDTSFNAYSTKIVKRILQKAAKKRHGYYWDDLYKIASATITKPKHASLRALFKKPSNEEYRQHNHTTNNWYAHSSEGGKVVMNESWKAKKVKDFNLPLYAKHNAMVASRGDYELRTVRQRVTCGCLESPYKDSCVHGNRWPVKYVWFKVTYEMRPYTGYVKRDGTVGYEAGYSRYDGRGYVYSQPMKVEVSRRYASKKEIAKFAKVSQEEIRAFLWRR